MLTYKYNTEENNKFQNTRLEGFNDSKDVGHESVDYDTVVWYRVTIIQEEKMQPLTSDEFLSFNSRRSVIWLPTFGMKLLSPYEG